MVAAPRAIGLAFLSLSWIGFAAAGPEQKPVDYNRDIRPILSNVCYKCHGPDAQHREAGLRLDVKAAAFAQLESGARAIVPGDLKESQLVYRITAHDADERMPPPSSGRTLTAKQIALLTAWVAQGAVWKPHWAFVAPQRPAEPKVQHVAWARSPIDRWILARLEAEGLPPSPPADPLTMIRRVTLDLTGLPPTLGEIDAFSADPSEHAYENLVDRLLASPRYGEQMARYWLDAARYGDTHGLHLDNERAMWPYRDWLIAAFNRNEPFNQFTIEQLAGDLLRAPTLDQRIATGFNRCNVTTSEGGAIAEEFQVRYSIDRTNAMATVWMGMTVGCAVCHDHKFDPLQQKEYYRLYAYFNSMADPPMDGNALRTPPVVRIPSPEQTRQQEAYEKQLAQLRKQVQQELAKIQYTEPAAAPGAAPAKREAESLLAWAQSHRKTKKNALPAPVQQALAIEATKRTAPQQKTIRDYYLANVYGKTRGLLAPLEKQIAELTKKLADLDQAIPASLVTEELKTPRPAFVLRRGEYDKPLEKVERGVPALFPPLPKDAPNNRLGLARWLVDPTHPLTARVIVNRFWQQYFGTGIVKTAEDFGSQGEWPSHPELLDWLATEFIASGWDVKHMQRLIVTSAAYRQSSRITPELYRRDPENRLLAHGPCFRMDAEMVRDNALAISGLLSGTIGGPSGKTYQPSGLWEAVGYTASNTARFVQDHGDALYRRSMYVFWKRTSPPPTLTLLDAPSRETCTVRRSRTNTPVAALALLNDPQFFEAARRLAQRMMLEGGSTPETRIAFAFRLATARPPRASELAVLRGQFQAQLADFRRDRDSALKVLSVGESPRDESLDAAELAAWTMVANVILNLDETLTKG
jgi:hypothetical protein